MWVTCVVWIDNMGHMGYVTRLGQMGHQGHMSSLCFWVPVSCTVHIGHLGYMMCMGLTNDLGYSMYELGISIDSLLR